jgi:hypothetical protein
MVIVIGSAMNLTLWSLQQQDKVTQAIVEKANSNQVKFNENLFFSDIRISNNKLNLTISNDVATAARLTTIYVVNETSQQQYRYDLNIAVDGRETVINIGQSNPSIIIKDYMRYTIKVVSESGNSVTARIRPVSEVAFPMSLYVIPSTVTTLENVTLLFSVTNNLTNGDILASKVTPILDKTLSCGSGGANCEFTDYVSPVPRIIPTGNTALFKWVFKVTAPVGTTMTFNASLTNAKEGNYVIETGRVEIVQESVRSNEVILGPSLLQRPDVFLLAPGPFGDTSSQGYWGVVMANPVNITMTVKKVAINVYSSTTDAGAKILTKTGCSVVGITPSSGWDCPHDGVIRWQNLDDPVTIQPYSAHTFLAKAVSESLPANQPQAAFIISIYVFTDFGQFTRQGYATNMYDSSTSVVNVYLTDTTISPKTTEDAHIFGNMTLTGNSTARVYVGIADFDSLSGTQINSGATLIINIPAELGDITLLESVPGFSSATATPYPDGTVQIRAITNTNIGNKNMPEAEVFYFDVNVPSTSDTITYAMHTFLEGAVNTAQPFPADAFGTFALIVCPDSGCT